MRTSKYRSSLSFSLYLFQSAIKRLIRCRYSRLSSYINIWCFESTWVGSSVFGIVLLLSLRFIIFLKLFFKINIIISQILIFHILIFRFSFCMASVIMIIFFNNLSPITLMNWKCILIYTII